MSRLTRILLCVVLLVVIAVAAMAAYLYASLSAEAVKERLTAYAADNLASDLHLTGEITVKRFPALEVTLPAARLTSRFALVFGFRCRACVGRGNRGTQNHRHRPRTVAYRLF